MLRCSFALAIYYIIFISYSKDMRNFLLSLLLDVACERFTVALCSDVGNVGNVSIYVYGDMVAVESAKYLCI